MAIVGDVLGRDVREVAVGAELSVAEAAALGPQRLRDASRVGRLADAAPGAVGAAGELRAADHEAGVARERVEPLAERRDRAGRRVVDRAQRAQLLGAAHAGRRRREAPQRRLELLDALDERPRGAAGRRRRRRDRLGADGDEPPREVEAGFAGPDLGEPKIARVERGEQLVHDVRAGEALDERRLLQRDGDLPGDGPQQLAGVALPRRLAHGEQRAELLASGRDRRDDLVLVLADGLVRGRLVAAAEHVEQHGEAAARPPRRRAVD